MWKYALYLGLLGILVLYQLGVLFPEFSPPSDEAVRALGKKFERSIDPSQGLEITSRGALVRDRDTLFWSLFSDHFGSNPNTPYMWNALPLFGYFLPSPMWHVRKSDAVVSTA
jgi:hypothetical protein